MSVKDTITMYSPTVSSLRPSFPKPGSSHRGRRGCRGSSPARGPGNLQPKEMSTYCGLFTHLCKVVQPGVLGKLLDDINLK